MNACKCGRNLCQEGDITVGVFITPQYAKIVNDMKTTPFSKHNFAQFKKTHITPFLLRAKRDGAKSTKKFEGECKSFCQACSIEHMLRSSVQEAGQAKAHAIYEQDVKKKKKGKLRPPSFSENKYKDIAGAYIGAIHREVQMYLPKAIKVHQEGIQNEAKLPPSTLGQIVSEATT